MLPEVKNKLIFLYTKVTGVILTLVVIMAFFLVFRIEQKNAEALFRQSFDEIREDIFRESVVSTAWIKKQRGTLVLWDNGIRMHIPGEELSDKETAALESCIEKSRKKGYFLVEPMVGENKGAVRFCFLGEGLQPYFGGAAAMRVEGGFRSLVYFYPYSELSKELGFSFVCFLFLDLLGTGAFYLLNRRLIGRILKPVEQAKKQQTEFIAAASHELRTPLAVMKANLSMVEARPVKEVVRIMQKECSRLESLTEDLLLLAAADAGQWRLEKTEVDIEGVLIELYESYETLFRKKELKFCLEFPEKPLPELCSDEKRIRQVLAILLTNALRFAPEGSQVRLLADVEEKKRRIFLCVEDQGKGIPKELREKIFERFYQTDASRKETGHFGLGLSIAKEVALVLGGGLSCRETPGGGATFVFSLPF